MVNVKQDLTGHIFGRLTVLARADDYIPKSGKAYSAWLCKCKCGTEKVFLQSTLTTGHSKSCGCLRKERMRQDKETHGGIGTKLYNSWRAMRERCSNPNANNYNLYGGRGISVCEEWNDFSCFRSWAEENGYKPGLSIDRINPDGNYEPDNCRWLSSFGQCNNKRNNRLITMDGITKTLSEWAYEVGIKSNTIRNRIDNLGWDVERALKQPVRG